MMRKERLMRKLGMRNLGVRRARARREVRVRKGQVLEVVG